MIMIGCRYKNDQWTLAGAKKFAIDMSGIDQTSNVDYKTLTDLNSQNKRSSRGLKSDLEATLNKKYNQWLGGSGNNNEMGKISRAEQLRQLDSKSLLISPLVVKVLIFKLLPRIGT